MAHESTGLHSCLSDFSRESRRNSLARGASSNVSTYVRSWTAICLGFICLGVTFFVLFEDVLAAGAKVTTDHALTLAVLLTVAAAGHMWWQQARTWNVFAAFGLIIVFAAGLVYLVLASGGRNAETAANKRNAAHFANAERERIKPLFEEAEGMRSSTARKVKTDCVDGKASKKACDGLRTSLAVYEAAVKGHEAALEKLGPPVEENVALKSTARVIVAFKDVAANQREIVEKQYVERLELIVPYIKAVLVELATAVFLGCGIGHRAITVPAKQPATARTTVVSGKSRPQRDTTVRQLATIPANPEALTLQLLQRSAVVPQSAVVQLFGGDKARASRLLSRLEREGRVKRASEGRSKVVALL